jgi:hypothetical protein
MVQDLTEHKADQRVDFNNLFSQRLVKFCQEKQFWWRKSIFSIYTIANVPTYDFSQTGTDVNGNPLPGVLDWEQFIKAELWLNGQKMGELEPNFDIEDISDAQEQAPLYQGMPGQYCIEPGTLTTVRLMQCPDGAGYKAKFAYWQIPQPVDDSDNDTIPLIPVRYHHALVTGLKMDITGFLYGEKADLYAVAQAEYMDSVAKAVARPDISSEKKLQFIVQEEGVRSTVGDHAPGSYITDDDIISAGMPQV